jgi:hypothetical protein
VYSECRPNYLPALAVRVLVSETEQLIVLLAVVRALLVVERILYCVAE